MGCDIWLSLDTYDFLFHLSLPFLFFHFRSQSSLPLSHWLLCVVPDDPACLLGKEKPSRGLSRKMLGKGHGTGAHFKGKSYKEAKDGKGG